MKSYLITDPAYYHDLKSFELYIQKIFRLYKPDFACFRDKKNKNILPFAELFLYYCKKVNINRVLVNSHLKIALKLNFDGVHLPASSISLTSEAKKRGLYVIVSTHSLKEAQLAQTLGADCVTISPVFTTPNKGKAKGVAYLKEFTKSLNIKVFALGGIVSKKHLLDINSSGVYGFASIRYFI